MTLLLLMRYIIKKVVEKDEEDGVETIDLIKCKNYENTNIIFNYFIMCLFLSNVLYAIPPEYMNILKQNSIWVFIEIILIYLIISSEWAGRHLGKRGVTIVKTYSGKLINKILDRIIDCWAEQFKRQTK